MNSGRFMSVCRRLVFPVSLPYMIRMALHGYVIVMDLSDLKEVLRLLQISGNNLNQYAKKANETGSIYHEDIEELRTNQKEILQEMRKVLDRLTAIM